MLTGIRLLAHPKKNQKVILSQWMGCGRYIWNAKCDEDTYLTRFARKYLPVKTYAPFDQSYSQYKNKELSSWLYDCPSQILRNSVSNWYKTYQRFLSGECGKPKRKKKSDGGSIHLTRELFDFKICDDGITRLFIGTKTNNIGFLSIKTHASFKMPNSIYIKKKNGQYWVSFCYQDELDESTLATQKEHLEYLKKSSKEFLESHTVGWHYLETFTKYKAHREGKAFFKILAHHTSQECAACSHIHPDNRKRQDLFICESCGHSDNADHNAALVIKKRAIKLILNSGTELSERGVLLDSGRGAVTKTREAKATRARGKEASKKKRKVARAA